MTARLENAIRQLPPDKIEQVTRYAESLARSTSKDGKDQFLSLDWVGAAAHLYPEHRTGVEAAHAAATMWRKSLDNVGRD
jgi:hypothetical protein